MAIDSQRKRRSIASLGIPIFGVGVVPDGTLDNYDRAVMAWGYAWIGAVSVTPAVNPTMEMYANSIVTGSLSLNSIVEQDRYLLSFVTGSLSMLSRVKE